MVDLAQAAAFRLGPLLVEPSGLRVRADDAREEAIEPLVMQVLVALAEAGGEVVSRDELIRRCWDGRIVGDDSINRVIGKLRRTAEGLGGGAFRIETVTKVGYRLVDAQTTSVELPNIAVTEPSAGTRKPRRLGLLAGAAALTLTAGTLAWKQSGPSEADAQPGLSFAGFAALDSASSDAARAMGEELRTALQDSSVRIEERGTAPAVAGTVRRAGGALRVTVRVDDPSSRHMLWSRAQQVTANDAPALAGAMQELADTLRCGLDGLASRSPQLTKDEVTLHFSYCEGTSGSLAGKDLQRPLAIARALTLSAPTFAKGWLGVASVAGGVLFQRSDEPLRAEGLAAARKLAALRPDMADGYAMQAVLLPASQPVARERLLRRALPLPSLSCRCGRDFLGDFLLQTGRTREALAAYGAAEGDKIGGPSGGILTPWRLSVASELSGDRPAADRFFAKLEPDFGPVPGMRRQRALWRSDWNSLLSPTMIPSDDPKLAAVWPGAIAALSSTDAIAKARAAAALRKLPLEGREVILPHLLAQLGDHDAAFALLEESRRTGGRFAAPGRFPGMSQPLLWDPALRPLWRDARFGTFLRRAGFIDYWQKTRSRPDICAGTDQPGFCRAI